jgi:hypothetical protein
VSELDAFERSLRAARRSLAAARRELAKIKARREKEISKYELKRHGHLAEGAAMRNRLEAFDRADEALAGADSLIDEAQAEANDA